MESETMDSFMRKSYVGECVDDDKRVTWPIFTGKLLGQVTLWTGNTTRSLSHTQWVQFLPSHYTLSRFSPIHISSQPPATVFTSLSYLSLALMNSLITFKFVLSGLLVFPTDEEEEKEMTERPKESNGLKRVLRHGPGNQVTSGQFCCHCPGVGGFEPEKVLK